MQCNAREQGEQGGQACKIGGREEVETNLNRSLSRMCIAWLELITNKMSWATFLLRQFSEAKKCGLRSFCARVTLTYLALWL